MVTVWQLMLTEQRARSSHNFQPQPVEQNSSLILKPEDETAHQLATCCFAMHSTCALRLLTRLCLR